MSRLLDDLQRAIRGRYPLIYMHTPEEERVFAALADPSLRAADGTAWTCEAWTCTDGLYPVTGDVAVPGMPTGTAESSATRDPVAALRSVLAARQPGFHVFKDLPEHFDDPAVVRALRDAYAWLGGESRCFVVLTSPRLAVPSLLEKAFFLITVPPPGEAEILATVERMQAVHADRHLPADLAGGDLSLALKGMTLRETEHVMHRIFEAGELTRASVLDEVYREKEMIVKKSGFLEFVPPRFNIDDIGGLDVLKDWLIKRKHLFSREALESGMPVPKGFLNMGVSGCGKSLTAKVVSSLWNVPLFRLDMNLIFSGMYGSPEAAFSHALNIVEAVSPVILWVDEIENGLASAGADGGGANHIFSAFLTWMQEKPPLIFVAATANRIEALPAEMLRKGRFDQVFFVDLPTETERKKIFEIHLRRNGVDPAKMNVDYVVLDTDGWNGAEIEQAVVSAMIDARQENRPMEAKDLMRTTANMVPLSETMREQIKSLRDWAYKRAVSASTPAKRK